MLAILTGLAAGAPAQARVAGFEGVQLETARERAPACEARRQLAVSAIPANAFAASRAAGSSCPRPVVAIVIPTVQLGVDRARE